MKILGIFENFEHKKKKDSITVVHPSCIIIGPVEAKGPGLSRDRAGHSVGPSEFTKPVPGCSL